MTKLGRIPWFAAFAAALLAVAGSLAAQTVNGSLAIAEAKKTLELEPDEGTAHFVLGMTHLKSGNNQASISEFQGLAEADPQNPGKLEWLAYAYAVAGQKEKALSVLERTKQLCRKTYCPPTGIAYVYGALGQKDEAFAWLDKALVAHDRYLLAINVTPLSDPLRSDPRFAEVLRRSGLP